MFSYRINNYDEDGDYIMNNPIENKQIYPKSILKTTKKETSSDFGSNKQVSFSDERLVVHYYLSPEERMDKYLHFRSIKDKRKYYY